jgi:hypothetical protein
MSSIPASMVSSQRLTRLRLLEAYRDQQVHRDHKVYRDLQDQLVPLALPVLLVPRDLQGRRELIRRYQDLRVLQVQRGHKVLKAILVLRVLKELLEQQDHRVRKVILVSLVLKVFKVFRVTRELRGPLGRRVPRELLAHKVLLDKGYQQVGRRGRS